MFPLSKTILSVAGVAVVLALGLTIFLYLWGGTAPSEPNAERNAFREGALQAGITFRMAFLPGEQGEKFKINFYDHGCGLAVADFDGDGHDDVYFVNQLGPNVLYRNKGDGTFEDVTARAGVALGDRICVGAAFGDYDNDGFPDLFVTSTRGGNVLFHNNGDGTFTDMTKQAGVALVAHSQTAAFVDLDNDGFLDLFVTNTARWTTDTLDPTSRYYLGPPDFRKLLQISKEHNVLYHNNGDGTFTDVTARAGLRGKGWGGDVAAFDYDEDGWLDLYVTNMFGAAQLYRNKHDGTFEEVTAKVLGHTSWGSNGCRAFDFNNDGRLDLFAVDMHSDMWPLEFDTPAAYAQAVASEKKKYPVYSGPYPTTPEVEAVINPDKNVLFGNTLFKNTGGKFVEMSERAKVETWWPWGIATGDFDNDGYEDAFLPSGMGYPFYYWPNYLLMNNGDETFTDRAAELGIEPPPGGKYLDEKIGGKQAPRSSRCAAVADFDGDGRLDLMVNNFNDRAFYFRNHFPRRNYIAFRLTGRKTTRDSHGSNRDAVGAVVKLYFGKEVMVRQVPSAGGYLSQSSRTLHFGLGSRTRIDRIEIRWPSGIRETIDNPEEITINTLHRRTEPEK